MRPAGFLTCLGVEALKVKRTMALALAVLLPAAPVAVYFMVLLREGQVTTIKEISPASVIVQSVFAVWASLVFPVFAAVEGSLLAGIEHQNRGWKHLFALPPARGSVIAAKFAASSPTRSCSCG